MLTYFNKDHDFEKPVLAFEDAILRFREDQLCANLGQIAVEWGAMDNDITFDEQGAELRRQYEGMNNEQRKGFEAALIALTGYSYASLVEEAIQHTRQGGFYGELA